MFSAFIGGVAISALLQSASARVFVGLAWLIVVLAFRLP